MLKKLKNKIPVVFAFTPDYFVAAATCIYSLLEHSEKESTFHLICLLGQDLPERMKDKLRLLVGKRANFTFLLVNKEAFAGISVNPRYTEAAYYRLLLPELLTEYDKVLYIDCDVVIRQDMAELYSKVNIDNHYIAGVFEATLDFQIEHLNAIGCKPGEYINSGLLILNLALLRSENLKEKFIEALKNDQLEFPDQDVLNQICKGRIMGLEPYYNSIRTFFIPQYKVDFLKYYSEESWEKIQRQGTVHYTGAKPWKRFTVKFALWWNYYRLLPKEIRAEGQIDKKMYWLFQLSNNLLVAWLIGNAKSWYRRFKYD